MNEPRRFIQVLAGPRQVGKSTLIGQVLNDCTLPHYSYNADGVDENDSDWIRRIWESTRVQMDSKQQTEVVLVIDEIQKIRQNLRKLLENTQSRLCRHRGRALHFMQSIVSPHITVGQTHTSANPLPLPSAKIPLHGRPTGRQAWLRPSIATSPRRPRPPVPQKSRIYAARCIACPREHRT